jgi:hypothetical protein
MLETAKTRCGEVYRKIVPDVVLVGAGALILVL